MLLAAILLLTDVSAMLAAPAAAVPVTPAVCEAAARCSCVAIPDIRKHRDTMSDVFVGTAIAQRDTFLTPAPRGATQASSHAIVSLVVRKRWKGAAADTVHVMAAKGDGGNCGVLFRIGERYLVFARRERGVATTNACLQTNLEALSSRQMRDLGRPLRIRIR